MEYTYEAIEFGIRLRNIRKKRGYTQERLSEKLYLSTDSISNYENGKTTCMPEHVTKICQILNVSADYLYFGIERELMPKESTELDKISIILDTCNDFDLCKIYSMIQILLQQPTD